MLLYIYVYWDCYVLVLSVLCVEADDILHGWKLACTVFVICQCISVMHIFYKFKKKFIASEI